MTVLICKCLPAQTPTVAFTTGTGNSGGVTPTHASSEFGPEALFQCHQNTDAEAKLLWITFFKKYHPGYFSSKGVAVYFGP